MIAIGGRADFQHVVQQGLTFRDNFSFTNLKWNGEHLVKIGAKLSLQKYKIGGTGPMPIRSSSSSTHPPTRPNLDFGFPDKVSFGGGNPNLSARRRRSACLPRTTGKRIRIY